MCLLRRTCIFSTVFRLAMIRMRARCLLAAVLSRLPRVTVRRRHVLVAAVDPALLLRLHTIQRTTRRRASGNDPRQVLMPPVLLPVCQLVLAAVLHVAFLLILQFVLVFPALSAQPSDSVHPYVSSSTGLLISWPTNFLLVLYRPSNLRARCCSYRCVRWLFGACSIGRSGVVYVSRCKLFYLCLLCDVSHLGE